MTGSDNRPSRFVRVPRASDDAARTEHARAKLTESLDAIDQLLHHAAKEGREAFQRDSPAYACGSMVIIRIAALFETDAFDQFLGATPQTVRRAITTTRNIASHSGYRSMNDDLLWSTLTEHLPPYLASWRSAVSH